MSKTMKRIVSLVLVVLMLGAVEVAAVACTPEEKKTSTYTYKSYSTALGTNWNPHT